MGEGPTALVAGPAARGLPRRAPLQRNGEAATSEGAGRPGERERVGVSRLALDDAVARLRASDALEQFSPLTGASALLIDVSPDADVPPDALGSACARMAELPSPTIALVDHTSAALSDTARTLAARADVLVARTADLDAILETIGHAPLAAMTLVQLLRASLQVDLHTALVAESLAYGLLQSGPEHAHWLAGHTVSTTAPETEPPVIVGREADRLTLTLNRPTARNAFSAAMRDALAEALALASTDDSITEIVLRGEGPAFCSGGDLTEFGTRPDPVRAHAVRATRHVGRWLAACAARVRVELHGACVGAGVELPAFAAVCTARRDAFFQLPEVGMGLVPGAGGTASLPRRIGRQRTAWLALTGTRLDAATAHAWGLVDTLLP